jgi:hypothetical protein
MTKNLCDVVQSRFSVVLPIMITTNITLTCCVVLQIPFYEDLMNYACVGFWTGLVFTCAMLVGLLYTRDTIIDPEQKVKHAESMTMVRRRACCSAVLCSADKVCRIKAVKTYCTMRSHSNAGRQSCQ